MCSRAFLLVGLLSLLAVGCQRVPAGMEGALHGAGDQYLVYQVQGVIRLASGALLKRGDRLAATTRVVFDSEDATALLSNLTTGHRYVLRPKTQEGQTDASEKATLLTSNLFPDQGPKRISSRGPGIYFQPENLTADYCGPGGLPTDTLRLLYLDPDTLHAAFLQPAGRGFLYVQYAWRQQMIAKELPVVSGQPPRIVLDIPSLLMVDGQPITLADTDGWQLVWSDGSRKLHPLVTFRPVVTDTSTVFASLDLLVLGLQESGLAASAIADAVWEYLAVYHGRLPASSFEALLRRRYCLEV